MPLLVTMHVYSGVVDPQWTISGDIERELRDKIAATSTPGIAADQVPGLGYRGFSVMETTGGVEPTPIFSVKSASGALTKSHSIAGIPEIEDFLLWTGHEHVTDTLAAHVQQTTRRLMAVSTLAAAVTCPPCQAQDAPAYNPTFWNTPQRQPNNNCYNYANDQATNTFAQPGRATGHQFTTLTCASVRPAAQSDGLVPRADFSAQLGPGAGWYVALVIWPGNDYHWYRQDNTGCWSHKPGSTPVRNIDNAGQGIQDPRTCDRGPYSVFCSFMVSNRTVQIR